MYGVTERHFFSSLRRRRFSLVLLTRKENRKAYKTCGVLYCSIYLLNKHVFPEVHTHTRARVCGFASLCPRQTEPDRRTCLSLSLSLMRGCTGSRRGADGRYRAWHDNIPLSLLTHARVYGFALWCPHQTEPDRRTSLSLLRCPECGRFFYPPSLYFISARVLRSTQQVCSNYLASREG